MHPHFIPRALAVALLATFLVACPSRAALIEQDYLAPGDHPLTLDTATHLQWLDLSLTLGLSHADLRLQLSPSHSLANFRPATEDELVKFWSDAGLPDIATDAIFNPTPANDAPVATLQTLWGTTGP